MFAHIHTLPPILAPTHAHTHTHTYSYTHTHTHAVQDPSVMAITSGTSQDDYNHFADNGAEEKEAEVKEVVSNIACVALIRVLYMVSAM